MKIKSIVDVITNSSSECYTVKSNLDLGTVSDMVMDYIENKIVTGQDEYYKDWKECCTDDTVVPVVEGANGVYHVDWDVLCNLDDAHGMLCELFGEENVTDDGGYARSHY